MTEIYNFSAGPAALPKAVLQQAQSELLSWNKSGISAMELSHRGEKFGQIIQQARADLCELMHIPNNYQVLFLQGGGRLQFAMVPLNLLGKQNSIDLVHSGHWSNQALIEAKRYAQVKIIASSENQQFSYIPEESKWQRNADAAYLYFVSNETVNGVQFATLPQQKYAVPLVCDMSSDFLSREVDVSAFGLIFAAAQKNLGMAGLTLVIVREDLLKRTKTNIPSMLDYSLHAKAKSMYNTPPTYAIYIASLVLAWQKAQGGIAALAKLSQAKSELLYQSIDASEGFYINSVRAPFRSKMNVIFNLHDATLNTKFFKQAAEQGLVQLNGHRELGGIRASIYNSMPIAGAQALSAFMLDFARKNA